MQRTDQHRLRSYTAGHFAQFGKQVILHFNQAGFLTLSGQTAFPFSRHEYLVHPGQFLRGLNLADNLRNITCKRFPVSQEFRINGKNQMSPVALAVADSAEGGANQRSRQYLADQSET